MTIIVYKDGVVAADRLLAIGIATQHITKMHILPDGRLAAGGGTIANVSYWMAALRGEVPRHPLPDGFNIDGIVVSCDGRVEIYSNSLFPYSVVNNNFLAFGSDAACFAAQVLHHQNMSCGNIVGAIAKESGFSGVDIAACHNGEWRVDTILIGEPRC